MFFLQTKLNKMRKYFQVAKNTFAEMTTYRLNFITWRIRVIIGVLTIYFLWLSILPKNTTLAGYNQQLMLTYILGTSIISSIVMSSRTAEIGENINNGDLSIFLIRPINYFKYWFAKDMGDKLMNILFSIAELSILYFILKPSLFVQTNIIFLFPFIIATILGLFLYFFFSCLLGLFGFWSPDVWGPRFIFYVVVSFFAGGLFPLDILPKPIFTFFQALPFTYFLYFPLKIYLGQLSMTQIFIGLLIAVVWIFLLNKILQFTWNKGLKQYSAVGR